MNYYTTMVIDMGYIWPRYGWDVDSRQVARKIGITYYSYVDQINTNMSVFLKCENIPDLLPVYCWLLSDYISDDDIIHLLVF